MQNRLISFLILALSAITIHAQQLEVVSVAGGDTIVDSKYFSYTIGETFIESGQSDEFILDAGFEKSNIVISTSLDKNEILLQAKVYPNPAVDFFFFEYENDNLQELKMVVHNTKGEFVFSQNISQKTTRVNLTGFPAAVYYLTVLDLSGKKMHQFKIIKSE